MDNGIKYSKEITVNGLNEVLEQFLIMQKSKTINYLSCANLASFAGEVFQCDDHNKDDAD
jgi:hypothetical protein